METEQKLRTINEGKEAGECKLKCQETLRMLHSSMNLSSSVYRFSVFFSIIPSELLVSPLFQSLTPISAPLFPRQASMETLRQWEAGRFSSIASSQVRSSELKACESFSVTVKSWLFLWAILFILLFLGDSISYPSISPKSVYYSVSPSWSVFSLSVRLLPPLWKMRGGRVVWCVCSEERRLGSSCASWV